MDSLFVELGAWEGQRKGTEQLEELLVGVGVIDGWLIHGTMSILLCAYFLLLFLHYLSLACWRGHRWAADTGSARPPYRTSGDLPLKPRYKRRVQTSNLNKDCDCDLVPPPPTH